MKFKRGTDANYYPRVRCLRIGGPEVTAERVNLLTYLSGRFVGGT